MLRNAERDGPPGRLYLWIAPLALLALVLLAACGGGDDDETGDDGPGNSPVASPIESRYLPVVISEDLSVGTQRFQMGLVDQEGGGFTPTAGAELLFKFYLLNADGQTAIEKFTAEPEAVTITKTYTHTHEDGLVETHEAGETGAYVAYVDFDAAGFWGVEVSGTLADGTDIVGEGEEPTRPFFQVSETSQGLVAGDPAPASVQVLASDVADIRSIDTSQDPIPEQHNMTIADAVASGKPTVIAFATPAFCVTQLCGPTKEIFDGLYEQYKDEANFIHVEPYDVDAIRSGECTNYGQCLNPVMDEWRLQSEPWVFIIDAEGKVASKYDGIVSETELEDGLKAVLPAS